MFPPKIRELMVELREQTEDGNLVWEYDDNKSKVITTYKNNEIQITYNFSEVKELGEFFVKIINKHGKEYFFGADQEYERDYEMARKLYDVAQSTDLDIDLD